jgi:hypothetical protein
VPISETGTATPGMSVARPLRRKMKPPRSPADRDQMQRALDVGDRGADGRGAVEHDGGIDAGGIEAWMNGSARTMRSTVAMMLAPGWRKMIM